jgi:DNA polymerase sigma
LLADFEQIDFDVSKIESWPYVKALKLGNLDLSKINLIAENTKHLETELVKFVSSQKVSEHLLKRRNGITKHLTKVLTNKFRGSKVTTFGSFQSGLNLTNGDIDLCLQFNGEKPKKVLKKIARMLNEDGMDNVKLITTAKVPIVKFIDNQSKIPVDISINNSLAVHNTELLRRYSLIDSRVKPFIISIKYWARNRGISDASMGTFSSYAWTLIAINYLQSLENEVLPNVLKKDGSQIVEIDGTKYDIGMYSDDELDFATQNQSTTGELVSGFFESLAKDWPWNNGVISVGSGKILARKEKNWVATKPYISDAIQDSQIKRLGRFSLPVEDPFDNKHDLSRVLDVEGIFEIRDEVLRAYQMISENTDWDTITEIKYPEMTPNEPKLDLFEDLRNQEDDKTRQDLKILYEQLKVIENSVSVRESERSDAIKMSKALRRNAELAKEQSGLSSELRPRRTKIDELQSKRDSSNNHYIPVHFIEEELSRVYSILTTEATNRVELSLEKEKQMFAWFFELQSMYEHSRMTRKYHREFLKLLEQQQHSIEHIKDIRQEMIEIQSFGKFTDFDDLAMKLLKELNPLKRERRNLRREIGRLEAWLRKQTHFNNNKHPNRKGKRKKFVNTRKVDDVKSKVVSGDSFSLQDLEVLLKNGGLSSVNQSKTKTRKGKNKPKKNNYSVTPQRGKRGKSSKNQ